VPKRKPDEIRNLVVVSDLHCGCQLGLCPPGPIPLDDGGAYTASPLQRKVWAYWREFWEEWVPHVCEGEPYAVCVNGDALDGQPHGNKTPISANVDVQQRIARMVLEPVIEGASAYYHIRGTEAHVGKSGEQEEMLARSLGAVPNGGGNHARWDLWLRLGRGLVYLTHHIGTTGSAAYESTAVMRELVDAYTEAARWGEEPPDVVVRSHRHRSIEVRWWTGKGIATSCTTPSWQLKTPFVFRTGGKSSQPQVGGILVRCGDDEIYTRQRVWPLKRSKEEAIECPT